MKRSLLFLWIIFLWGGGGTFAEADPAQERLYIREVQKNNKDMIVLRFKDKQLYRLRMGVGCLPMIPFDSQGKRGDFEGEGVLTYAGTNPFYNMGEGTLNVVHPTLRLQNAQGNDIVCQILRIDRFVGEEIYFNPRVSPEMDE